MFNRLELVRGSGPSSFAMDSLWNANISGSSTNANNADRPHANTNKPAASHKPARTSGINISKFMFIGPALEPEKSKQIWGKDVAAGQTNEKLRHQHGFSVNKPIKTWTFQEQKILIYTYRWLVTQLFYYPATLIAPNWL